MTVTTRRSWSKRRQARRLALLWHELLRLQLVLLLLRCYSYCCCCCCCLLRCHRRYGLPQVPLAACGTGATRALSSWLLLLLPPRVLVASSAASRATAVNCRLKPRCLLLRLVSSCFSRWRCWRLALILAAAAAAPVRVSCSCTTLCREPFHLPPTGVWYACTGATRALPLCRGCCCCGHRRTCSWPPARPPVQ